MSSTGGNTCTDKKAIFPSVTLFQLVTVFALVADLRSRSAVPSAPTLCAPLLTRSSQVNV